MKRRLTFSVGARRDLDAIIGDIHDARPSATGRFARELRKKWVLLREFPQAGSPRPEFGDGIRILILGPYLILYRVLEDRVMVTQICDGRRDLPNVLRAFESDSDE